jgi:hypothetical protein
LIFSTDYVFSDITASSREIRAEEKELRQNIRFGSLMREAATAQIEIVSLDCSFETQTECDERTTESDRPGRS